LEWIDEDSEN
jgi:hypothetical protein